MEPRRQTWDCPAHGSRLDGEGHVLDGPSSVDVAAAPVDLEQPALTGPTPQPSLPGTTRSR